MGDMFDYIQWRGDLAFSAVPFGPVDALVFSSLVYLDLQGVVPEDMHNPVPLHVAADVFSRLVDREARCRVKKDLELLAAAAEAPRFRDTRLGFYRTRLLESEETQFAAMACILEDGTAFLCFRGTDNTLVGWKEDFNMSFQTSVPAQREAAAYTREFADRFPVLLRLGGHSKGGNLAVYAGTKAGPERQQRILTVFNLDGPGFTEAMLETSGYQSLVPRIKTYIPESSIIGLLLEREEAHTVIASRWVGPLQHEPYSWELMAGDFVRVENLSAGSRFVGRTVKNWLKDMSREDREALVEALYRLLRAGGASRVEELLHPKSLRGFIKTLSQEPDMKQLLKKELPQLLQAVKTAREE